MIGHWILYLTVWIGCEIFYHLCREWFSWLLLVGITCLPAVSLLFSLPAMLTAKLEISVPAGVPAGTPLPAGLDVTSAVPTPRWKAAIFCTHFPDEKEWILSTDFPTDHCGMLECQVTKGKIYDYLGLFCLRLKAPRPFRVAVRPVPVPPENIPDLQECLPRRWKPKPGGGYSENHELRLYRPGDSLQQIHWKLTAKTGKLILREPMQPEDRHLVLWLDFCGGPDVLDQKLGQLLWLSSSMLEQSLQHTILANTEDGPRTWHIRNRQEQMQAIDELLCCRLLKEAPEGGCPVSAGWQFYIGGDSHEN